MNTIVKHALALLFSAVITVGALSGCSAGDETAGQAPRHLACTELVSFIVAVDRHNEAPGISSALGDLLEQAVTAGAAFAVFESDGTPSKVSTYRPKIAGPENPDARKKTVSDAVKKLIATVSSLQADSDGNDTLGAVSLAADSATSTGVTCNTVVILGAGNADRGELDVTAPGVLTASGSEVADVLAARKALPAFGAVRTDVILAGIGYTAADGAQTPLRQAERDNLAAIYSTVLTAAGATGVTDLRLPRTGNGPRTQHTVKPIVVPPPVPLNFCGTTVFDNASQLGFYEGTPDFRDEAAASATLAEFGRFLAGDPTQRLEIVGTTADWGSDEYQLNLAEDRARAAAALVIASGAADRQITVRWVGSHFPEYNPAEWLPDGSLDPIVANTNRSVRISFVPPRAGC